ncbi:hypothetical protein LZQ00_03045 [Sphingobacterium sp. SRCM116780]|uniref:hypothetical protein n=1 Tax=Sphingobacterium sp. SRCM116780 TaxID=2907623 RepID=UPI001F21942D|nr:hypothetical protein [Sphingobacterium sp. SRCM116780]UIR56801.1 hypothetical protein LZQ00_03045 [Sphingobacterium sp. SRCM116780]
MKLIFKILKGIGVLLIIYQFVSWMAMGIIYKEGKEQPMSDVQGFVVDDKGNIIIGDGFYQIIQVYDKEGRFVTGWQPKTYGGSFQLFLGENGTIIIEPSRSAETLYYNLNGVAITNKEIKIATNNLSNQKHYTLKGGMFFPKISKEENGHTKVVVAQNLLQNLLKAPFPFLGIGAFLLLFFGAQETMKKIKEFEKKNTEK